MEILDLTDAQQQRFLNAYDVAKEVMRDLGIFPAKNERRSRNAWRRCDSTSSSAAIRG